MTTTPTCIIAYTSEDNSFPEVRKAAIETARSANARLILYDIDAATPFAKPLPTDVSAEGAKEQVPNRLTVADLERAGRPEVMKQLQTALSMGIDAYAWLPGEVGGDALAEYADQQNADLIMLPEEMDDPSLFDRIRNKTVDSAVEETHRPIAIVRASGEVEMMEHEKQSAS
jgi:hypothetical protein